MFIFQGVVLFLCFAQRLVAYKHNYRVLRVVPVVMERQNVQRRNTKYYKQGMVPSHLIAMGDYATEIEKAVGTEIYTPIFQAGLFIFASGIISALITGSLVNSWDSWDALDEEIQAGKEEQLLLLDKQEATELQKMRSSIGFKKVPEGVATNMDFDVLDV